VRFGLLDWAITVVSLVATVWIGLRTRRYVGRIEDYLVANRGMGVWVGTASLVSTEIGIITYMYQAQFGFLAGFSAFIVGLITIGVCFAIGRTGFVISRLRELEVMTVPEYLERRYSRRVRVLAGVMMAVGGSLNLGIFPLIEARYLSITAGIPPRFVAWTMAALLLIALAYTALGGMLSLMVTNYLQYVLLAAGTLVITAVCLGHIGWSGMTGAVVEHMHGRGLDPFADLGPAFVLWQVLLWVAFMTVWQSAAMRGFSARDAATGRKVFTLTSVLFLGRAVIPMAWGIAALAFFAGGAEPAGLSLARSESALALELGGLSGPPRPPSPGEAPASELARVDAELATGFRPLLEEGRLEALLPRVDRLEALARAERSEPHVRRAQALREEIGMVAMPWMVAALIPSGLAGLVMAGMLAASVSTYAGYFLGWSAVLSQDVVSPLLGRQLSEEGKLRLTRATIVALVAFIMVWSLVYRVPGPAYFYLQVTANLFMAPTLLTIAAGLYWPPASAAGAWACFLLGAAASLAYLVPGSGLSVGTAGNLSWGLALLGLVAGSLLRPSGAERAPQQGAA
jgi:Na+/proline symporter